jgi:hypothetical protein
MTHTKRKKSKNKVNQKEWSDKVKKSMKSDMDKSIKLGKKHKQMKEVKTKDIKKPKPRHPNKLSMKELKQKTDRFSHHFYTAVTKIMEHDGIDWKENGFTLYVLQMLLIDNCLYNETTSPYFYQYVQHLYNNPSEYEKINIDGGEEDISTDINRSYLFRAISEYVSGGGGGKLKSKLQKLDKNWRTSKYA